MPLTHPALHFSHAMPFGAILRDEGVQFSIYSRHATSVRVLLYNRITDRDPTETIELNSQTDRWGDVWSVFLPGIGAGQLYHLQADGPFDPAQGHRFNPNLRLIDPWAKALAGDFQSGNDGIIRPPRCVVIDDDHFDWQGDRHLRRPLDETIIYEMHVRGFTRHRSSGIDQPGTYLGVIEKIPYLQSLGITAVELMPVHEFPINAPDGRREERPNYWGYDPMAFFSPHRGFAYDNNPGAQVTEFKQMVKALHQAGIEVLLDVVFNHTCEGNELGPTLSFKGLENRTYYILTDDNRAYKNYSGCGNTINGNHPVVRDLILDCLRHWVLNYHVDGFRFDLASILARGRRGEMLPFPPIIERIAEDPVLADTKIIAEAWDAAGAYQVGSFPGGRWAEWNGRYRDDVRRYWRGDPHLAGAMATRLTGSSDLYQHSGRRPFHSINFITAHDGFSMNDLVSYNEKHNLANGEDNRDGENNNNSYNYGVEGPTSIKGIERIRMRQIKNMQATLLLSLGVPMVLSGDEIRRTQQGNNNAYCQDNIISWFNWRLTEKYSELGRFIRVLMNFRRNQPTVRRKNFKKGQPPYEGALPDASWFNPEGEPMYWDTHDSSLVALLGGAVAENSEEEQGVDVLLLLHPGADEREFVIPSIVGNRPWRLFINTAAASPNDIYPRLNGPTPPASGRITLPGRSLLGYVSPPVVPQPTDVLL